MELGILSLGDLQRDQRTGRPHRSVDRMAEVLGYAVLAHQLGLDVFALGEHHSAEFFTSPARRSRGPRPTILDGRIRRLAGRLSAFRGLSPRSAYLEEAPTA